MKNEVVRYIKWGGKENQSPNPQQANLYRNSRYIGTSRINLGTQYRKPWSIVGTLKMSPYSAENEQLRGNARTNKI